MSDLFHTVVDLGTWKILVLFFCCYTFTYVLFSVPYYWMDKECGLKIKSWLDAFYFSLEVGSGVGWGVLGSPYFKEDPDSRHGCYDAAGVILTNTVLIRAQDAMLIGILFTRIARGTRRASSLCFSEKSVIREIQGKLYVMFQVCEMRKHQLNECHVRCYCSLVRETQQGPTYEQVPMRLIQPNDELGAMLLLTAPAVVIHEIDAWSPLCPREKASSTFPGFARRRRDFLFGMSDMTPPPSPTRSEVEAFLQSTWLEIAVIIEGIEPISSATIQARHSYTVDELVFDCAFAPTVVRDQREHWVVDIRHFHRLVPSPPTREDDDPSCVMLPSNPRIVEDHLASTVVYRNGQSLLNLETVIGSPPDTPRQSAESARSSSI